MIIKDTSFNFAQNGAVNNFTEAEQKIGLVPNTAANADDVNFIGNNIDKSVNSILKELTSVLTATGRTPDPLLDDQVLNSIKDLVGGLEPGMLVKSTLPLINAGLHLADGDLILAGGVHDVFYLHIKAIFDAGLNPELFISEVDYQTSITNYGVCGKYVFTDTVSVRIPTITGFTEGTVNPTAVGNLTEAGLPNIEGTVGDFAGVSGNGWSVETGAFYGINVNNADVTSGQTGSTDAYSIAGLDASLSSPIYGNSTTVQPQSIKLLYYIVVGNIVKTDLVTNIDNVVIDLNNKADKDLGNLTTAGEDKFMKVWTSTAQTAVASSILVLNHNLNLSGDKLLNAKASVYAICKIAQHGYSIGDRAISLSTANADYTDSLVPAISQNTIQVNFTNTPIFGMYKTAQTRSFALTPANWDIYLQINY